MSDAIARNLNLVKVLDSRLSAGEINQYAIELGPSQITYRNYPASNLSSSQLTFNNCNPPANTFVDRTVYVQVEFKIDFVGTCPAGQNLLDQWGFDIAPRALIVNNSFKNVVVSINGSNFTSDGNDLLPAFSRYHFDKLKSYLSQSCSVLDNCQKYSEAVGSNINALGSAQTSDATGQGVYARGGFDGVKILTNTPTAGSIVLSATEPLIISPLSYDDFIGIKPAFYNISSFNVNTTFDNDLAGRILSISDNSTATFTSVVANPLSSNIYFGYYTTKMMESIPRVVSYPYYNTQRYIQSGLTLSAGASATLDMNTIQISSVPRKIYIYLKPSRNSYNINQSDTYARVNTLSIQFGNKSSLLGNCNAKQIYDISKRNGLDMSWSAYNGSIEYNKPRNFSGCGGVVCIVPAKDLGLDELYVSGTAGLIQIQIKVSYTNIQPSGSAPLAYDGYVVVVSDGLATIPTINTCIQQDSVIKPDDVLNAQNVMPSLTTSDIYDYSGGSWWSDVKSWYDRNSSWIKPVAKGISSAIKVVVPETAPLLTAVGLGYSGGAYSGGGLVGGASISKKKLLQHMR